MLRTWYLLKDTSRQLTAAFDLIATFALAIDEYLIMAHNRDHHTHPQPAVPAVHTCPQPHRPNGRRPSKASPTRFADGKAGGSVELSVIPCTVYRLLRAGDATGQNIAARPARPGLATYTRRWAWHSDNLPALTSSPTLILSQNKN